MAMRWTKGPNEIVRQPNYRKSFSFTFPLNFFSSSLTSLTWILRKAFLNL